jgi:hypothetical protein
VIIPISGAALFLLLQAPAAKGTLEGVVVSAGDSMPIAGAQVIAMKISAPPGSTGVAGGIVGGTRTVGVPGGIQALGRPGFPSASTDNNGRFIFQDLEAGTYRLTATANAYARQEFDVRSQGQNGMATNVNLIAGQVMKDVVLRLTPAGNVSGQITGSAGESLVGMEVLLLKPRYDSRGRKTLQQVADGQTNDRGEYRLFWVPPGRYYLSAASSNRPLPGFNPAINVSNKYSRTYYPGTTDASAAVAIDVTPRGELGGIDLRLAQQSTYRIRGRVIQPATEQNPGRGGVSFSIVPRDSIVSSVGSSSAPYNAADGTFELVDIPPGSYWVSAQFPFSGRFEPGGPPPPRPPVAVAAVDVRNGDVDGVVLSVPSGNTISGQIRLDGPVGSTPFTFDRVNISLGPTAPVSFGMSRGFSPVRPLADGSFRIENVFPGEYQLGVGSQSPNIYVKEARLDSVDVLNHPLNVAGPVSSDLQIILG